MSLRKILSWIPPRFSQLGSADTVLAYGANMASLNNSNVGSIVIGTPVYSPSAGNFDKAEANAGTTVEVIGLAADTSISASTSGNIQTSGVVTATTGQWDAVAGTSGGLTAGTVYYLDPATAGKLTSTAPSTPGQYLVRVGKALSTTQLELAISQPILL
jgi:hypothetical protein